MQLSFLLNNQILVSIDLKTGGVLEFYCGKYIHLEEYPILE
jgi:hypothetical protein